MDTDSFVMNINTEDFFKDIADDVESWLIHLITKKKIKDHYQQEKTKKVIGKFKDELDGKIMAEFCALRPKAYAYKLDDDDIEMNKAKGKKKMHSKKRDHI